MMVFLDAALLIYLNTLADEERKGITLCSRGV